MKIELLETVDSTNEYAKRYLSTGEDRVICARRQTGGKGTKGRAFLSDEGGVYLTFLRFYEDLPAAEAFTVMTHAAVAVCKTAEAFGAACRIKWANDVFVGRRKLAGILIENEIAAGKLRSSLVGVGVNVCNDLSALGGIAVTLSEAAKRALSPEEVREKLIEAYLLPTTFEDYVSRLGFLNEETDLAIGGEIVRATPRGVAKDGRLIAEIGGKTLFLSAAEVKLTV